MRGQSAAGRGETRERILAAALRLFNESGTGAVSTNHIAEAAGLSVGNLYYHFKNKEEIIRALYGQVDAATDAAFSLDGDAAPGVADLERMLRANYEILWRYRFFYREMIALLHRDPALADHYRAVRRRGFANFADLMAAFAAGGVLRPIDDPAELDRLTRLCWLVSEFYPPFLEAEGASLGDAPAQIDAGVALLRQVLAPYLPDGGAR